MLSRRLKGKWSTRRRQGFHSTLPVSFTLRRHSTSLSNWYNLPLIFTCTNGGESKEGSQRLRFWRLMPKGERVLAQSKRTAPPLISNFFYWYISNWYVLFSIGIFRKIDSQNWYLNSEYISNWYLSKPS